MVGSGKESGPTREKDGVKSTNHMRAVIVPTIILKPFILLVEEEDKLLWTRKVFGPFHVNEEQAIKLARFLEQNPDTNAQDLDSEGKLKNETNTSISSTSSASEE